MITQEKKRILRSILAVTVSTVTIASAAIPAYSAPSTKELEITTSDLQKDLDNMNSQLSSLSADLDAASAEIEQLAAEVEKAKLDLVAAQLNEEAQYDAMKDRIKFMYEGGNLSLLQVLFSSENMADFLNKAEYVTTISEYDRSMLEELQKVSVNVKKKQKELAARQEELTVLQGDLTAKREALNSQIATTASNLEDYTAQLERARAAEEALLIAQNNAVSGSITGENASEISVTDVVLFAALLECEASPSDYNAMLAVATVVMNRLASPNYPATMREVIFQSGQFAPTENGSLVRALSRGPSETSYQVAKDALAGKRHASVLSCYEFRSAATTSYTGINIGGNIFF